ncbi:hypothetical protein GOBAR_AA29882 [Gossypium barbadense]|uniref:Cytochrome P450 n=1 Tax=Gossypium barbadense TaxID=3634 RepID=A0A2P5WI89_GOSBA|nr:hypothetical protein GOBAR_AA29882 [Gossypium barbadense]
MQTYNYSKTEGINCSLTNNNLVTETVTPNSHAGEKIIKATITVYICFYTVESSFVDAIIKETFRLYPPVPMLMPHVLREDCCVSGYHIPQGTRLFVNDWKLHRDPRVWSNPEEFEPERFLTSHQNVDVLGRNFELTPFGSGRRSCPGIKWTLQAVHLTMARLLQGFDLTTPLHAPVDMTEAQGASATMPKATPLELVLTPRLPPHLYHL